jgi:hypothetical protein
MRFPKSNQKFDYNLNGHNPITGNASMSNNLTRKEFLEDLPIKTRNIVRGVDLALINEAIEIIFDGQATVNGKAPDTRAERFMIIATYFKTARTAINALFDDTVNTEHKDIVEIKYKDKPGTYKMPSRARKKTIQPSYF